MTPTDPRKKGKPVPGAAAQVVYDVIVVGSHLGGVVTGALLAKRGYRVLSVDPDGLGAGYEHQGYRLPYAPGLLPHPRRLPPVEAALTELGIASDLFRTLDASAPALQWLFPRHRLELPPEKDRRSAELAREFSSRKDELLQALADTAGRAEASDAFFKQPLPFPPDGFFERWAVRKAARACPGVKAEEPFQAFAGTALGTAMADLGRFFTHLEAEESSLGHLRPVAQLLSGPSRLAGGALGLRELVRERLAGLGGALLGDEKEPVEIEELTFEGRRFAGVKLAGNSHVYRANCLVVATDVANLAGLIPPKAKKRFLTDLLESVRVRRHLFTLNLVVKEQGLPLGLGDVALVHPGDETHGPVLLEVLPAMKAGKEVPGEKVLCASAFVPHAEHSNADERLQVIGKRLEAVVLGVAPFLDAHVLLRSLPYREARNLKGTPLHFHPLLEVDAPQVLGIAGLPHRTPCKNMFLASREVVPGLGLEGEFLAAHRAAALVQGVLKRHDPLK